MNFNINKNVSVWRGNSSPPTDYHVWIKESGEIAIQVIDNLGNRVWRSYNFGANDIINLTELTGNLYINEHQVFEWLQETGKEKFNLHLHPGVKIRFREAATGKWREYIYVGSLSNPRDESYENSNYWRLTEVSDMFTTEGEIKINTDYIDMNLGTGEGQAYPGTEGIKNRESLNSLPNQIVTQVPNPVYSDSNITINVTTSSKSKDGLNIYSSNQTTPITLNSATEGSAGLMSAQDKATLDDIPEKLAALKLAETTPSNENTLKSYILQGLEGAQGVTIDIPKDKSIKEVRVADTNATIDDEGNIQDGDGTTALCIVYVLANGEYSLVKLDLQQLIEESEIGNGLELSNHRIQVKIDSTSEPYLTLSANGIKLSGIKDTVDKVTSIWEGNPDLVSPVISGSWTVYNQSNTVITPTPSFPLERGYKAKYTGTWKWTAQSGKKNPERTSGTWGTILPQSGVNSESFTSSDYITSNTTYSQSVFAKKLGLMVSGANVLPATGDDQKTASVSISFSDRIYYGVATSDIPSETIIKSLTNVLGGRSRTINGVTATTSQYYYYAYPKTLGKLTTIIQDGATPVLGAFTLNESISITNAAGLSIPMYVYVSNNPGAFTNNNLNFQ